MMGVDFSVRCPVVHERPVLCFPRPVFCASLITVGTGWGEKCHGGAVDFKALPPCLFPWERTKVLVEVCHLSNSTEFVREAGGAGLSAVPSGKGLISPRKAAGGPLWGPRMVWG